MKKACCLSPGGKELVESVASFNWFHRDFQASNRQPLELRDLQDEFVKLVLEPAVKMFLDSGTELHVDTHSPTLESAVGWSVVDCFIVRVHKAYELQQVT